MARAALLVERLAGRSSRARRVPRRAASGSVMVELAGMITWPSRSSTATRFEAVAPARPRDAETRLPGSKSAPCVEQIKYSPASSKNSPGCQSSSVPACGQRFTKARAVAVEAHHEALRVGIARPQREAHALPALGERGRGADHAFALSHRRSSGHARAARHRGARVEQLGGVRAVEHRDRVDARVGGELEVVRRVARSSPRAAASTPVQSSSMSSMPGMRLGEALVGAARGLEAGREAGRVERALEAAARLAGGHGEPAAARVQVARAARRTPSKSGASASRARKWWR